MKCQSRKREIIQSYIYRILPKFNQVVYTLNTVCEPNIMILAPAVLRIFCWQGSIGLQWQSKKRRKRNITLQRKVRGKKRYGSSYLSYLFHTSNFKILSITFLDRMQSVTDRDTDARTDARTPWEAQTNMPPQPLRSWGHNKLQQKHKLRTVRINTEGGLKPVLHGQSSYGFIRRF